MSPKAKLAEYVRLNGKYLKEAERFLAKGDLVQASEKLWGATAEIVKAVAAERGEELGTHRSIGEFITKLHKEHPEWSLIMAFNFANSLHTNFYENYLPKEHVETGATVVREFVSKLKTLL